MYRDFIFRGHLSFMNISDFVSLDIDPGNRLLYYIVLKRQEIGPGVPELCGSLVAYDINKNKSILLIDGALGKPASLALNVEYGYVC